MLEKYLLLRDPEGLPRLLMRPRQSVAYAECGRKASATYKKGGRFFNLHDPEEKCCFMGQEVLGKDRIAAMVPEFCKLLNLPRFTNKDVRTTAVQTLRMASFTSEEVAKVSRHRRASTIDRHYDIGLRTSTMADMAVALGQASSLKRGAESNSRIELASPAEMIPKIAGGATSSSPATWPKKTFVGDVVVIAEQSEVDQAETK
mgnify:CR=1 FL=1